MKLDEKLAKLDETIAILENGELSLEESLKLYEQGVALVKDCNKMIDKVEQKVLMIDGNGDKVEFE